MCETRRGVRFSQEDRKYLLLLKEERAVYTRINPPAHMIPRAQGCLLHIHTQSHTHTVVAWTDSITHK